VSKIRTMNTSTLVTLEGKFCSDPQPGDMIRYYMAPESLGTVVEKIDENNTKVLWSNFGVHDEIEYLSRKIREVLDINHIGNPDSNLSREMIEKQFNAPRCHSFLLGSPVRREERLICKTGISQVRI